MDQLKNQLGAVKQHSFWVMCVGILLVSLGSWWHSTGVLNKEKEEKVAKIEGAFTAVSSIPKDKHPNAASSQAMDLLVGQVAGEVAKAWDLQYSRQADVLVWPASFTPEFRQAVDKLRPIEIIPPEGRFENELPTRLLLEYRDYIDIELPSLAKKIGTHWTATVQSTGSGMGGYDAGGYGGDSDLGGMPGGYSDLGGMPGGYGGMPGGYGGMPGGYGGMPGGLPGLGGKPLEPTIVQWDSSNQQDLMRTHFGFTSRPTAPSTLEVLYAQEDFWVLDNLMDIIVRTNDPDGEGISGAHEAVIKRIYFVRLGRSAAGLAGQVQPIGGGGGGMGPYGMPGGMSSSDMSGGGTAEAGTATDSGSSSGGMPGMPGMPGTATASQDPAEGRYVDPTYQPLPASKLRSALTSTSAEDALLAVAKRMPVRMRFRMDQRRLNRLLAECGNAKLPVEVRQVRINRPPATAGGMGYGGYGGDTGMPGDMGMPGGMDMAGSGYDMGGGYDPGGYDPGSYPGGSDMGMMPGSEGYDPFSGGEYGSGGYPGGMSGATPQTRRAAQKGNVAQDSSIDPNLVDVELYGIVYIYNPVNTSQLGLDTGTTTEGAETPAEEAGATEQPADEPAPIPTTPTSTEPAPITTTPTGTGPAATVSGPVPPAAVVP